MRWALRVQVSHSLDETSHVHKAPQTLWAGQALTNPTTVSRAKSNAAVTQDPNFLPGTPFPLYPSRCHPSSKAQLEFH